jgi:hypothetical protein
MGINGRKKGQSAELAIVHEFCNRFNDHFQRVPSSGAWVGGQNRFKAANLNQAAKQTLAGDILCPPWFCFSLESKNYSEAGGPKMYSILEGDERVLDKWLVQSRGDAEFSNKQFMILFRITHKAAYIVVDYVKFMSILAENNQPLPNSFIKYKDTIILDKNDFLDNYIAFYLPLDKRNVKKTVELKNINNKIEVKSNDAYQPKTI